MGWWSGVTMLLLSLFSIFRQGEAVHWGDRDVPKIVTNHSFGKKHYETITRRGGERAGISMTD